MNYASLVGSLLVVIFGWSVGELVGAKSIKRCRDLEAAAEMLRRMLMSLEYQQPTVDEMLSQLNMSEDGFPQFVRAADGGRQAVLDELERGSDEISEGDRMRLRDIFLKLGSSGSDGERQRLAAGAEYFSDKAKRERPAAEQRAKLTRSLGVLGGIFAVILLI